MAKNVRRDDAYSLYTDSCRDYFDLNVQLHSKKCFHYKIICDRVLRQRCRFFIVK